LDLFFRRLHVIWDVCVFLPWCGMKTSFQERHCARLFLTRAVEVFLSPAQIPIADSLASPFHRQISPSSVASKIPRPTLPNDFFLLPSLGPAVLGCTHQLLFGLWLSNTSPFVQLRFCFPSGHMGRCSRAHFNALQTCLHGLLVFSLFLFCSPGHPPSFLGEAIFLSSPLGFFFVTFLMDSEGLSPFTPTGDQFFPNMPRVLSRDFLRRPFFLPLTCCWLFHCAIQPDPAGSRPPLKYPARLLS